MREPRYTRESIFLASTILWTFFFPPCTSSSTALGNSNLSFFVCLSAKGNLFKYMCPLVPNLRDVAVIYTVFSFKIEHGFKYISNIFSSIGKQSSWSWSYQIASFRMLIWRWKDDIWKKRMEERNKIVRLKLSIFCPLENKWKTSSRRNRWTVLAISTRWIFSGTLYCSREKREVQDK